MGRGVAAGVLDVNFLTLVKTEESGEIIGHSGDGLELAVAALEHKGRNKGASNLG